MLLHNLALKNTSCGISPWPFTDEAIAILIMKQLLQLHIIQNVLAEACYQCPFWIPDQMQLIPHISYPVYSSVPFTEFGGEQAISVEIKVLEYLPLIVYNVK